MPDEFSVSIDEYFERVPDERLRELSRLGAWMDTLLGDREPRSEDGEEPLWRHGKDPSLGRPR